MSKVRERLKLAFIERAWYLFSNWSRLGFDHMEKHAKLLGRNNLFWLQGTCTAVSHLQTWVERGMVLNKEKIQNQTVKPLIVSLGKGETCDCWRSIQALTAEGKLGLHRLEKTFRIQMRRVHLLKPIGGQEKHFIWLKWPVLWSVHDASLEIWLPEVTFLSIALKYSQYFGNFWALKRGWEECNWFRWQSKHRRRLERNRGFTRFTWGLSVSGLFWSRSRMILALGSIFLCIWREEY